MYRPKGWEKTKKQLCAESLGEKRARCSSCPAEPMTCDIKGEKLADAMLEGLRGVGKRTGDFGDTTKFDKIEFVNGWERGHWVFIPEE